MRKIKPQAIGSNQRSGLLHMFPETVPQGTMKKMGSSMVSGNIFPTFLIYYRLGFFPGTDNTFFDFYEVQNLIAWARHCIQDLGSSFRCGYKTSVAHLPTLFGIKGAPVQEQVGFLFICIRSISAKALFFRFYYANYLTFGT